MKTGETAVDSVEVIDYGPPDEDEEDFSENEDDFKTKRKYMMWLNRCNTCWLDCSMALIAHNKTIERLGDCSRPCRINDIVKAHKRATFILNDESAKEIKLRIVEARRELMRVQNAIDRYLQPRLKHDNGKPDSAFCCLLNLITDDSFYKLHFEVSWMWLKKCAVCRASHSWKRTKPIITLPRVNLFSPIKPTCIYKCDCSELEQEMVLKYIEIPPCLIFHFENGAGDGDTIATTFVLSKTFFKLTGIVTLRKLSEADPAHFVTWIRNPRNHEWLECDDLGPEIATFTRATPRIETFEDVYMVVYESNHSGKITVDVSAYEQIAKHRRDVPCIDITDES